MKFNDYYFVNNDPAECQNYEGGIVSLFESPRIINVTVYGVFAAKNWEYDSEWDRTEIGHPHAIFEIFRNRKLLNDPKFKPLFDISIKTAQVTLPYDYWSESRGGAKPYPNVKHLSILYDRETTLGYIQDSTYRDRPKCEDRCDVAKEEINITLHTDALKLINASIDEWVRKYLKD